MTSESDVDSPSASSPPYEGDNARAIIRQLLERHSREEVEHLVAEEASTTIPIDSKITFLHPESCVKRSEFTQLENHQYMK
ncbi:hypothetical protein E4U19_005728 [Claviceps sp. Clav32 group G5]|nr:hypothetical protein E4U19_005728 [Claviceps sp. Clav32 group G5]KAG6045677.1 hypothetical protein E4U39_002036 [Claviceps sp. Clav50 group G5]